MRLLFSPHKSRPTFWNFGPTSKSKTLKFTLACLLSEGAAGGGDGNGPVEAVLCNALVKTIKEGGVSSQPGPASILLDDAAACLSVLVGFSDGVKAHLKGPETPLRFQEMANLAINLPNSLARKNFSSGLARLLAGDGQLHEKACLTLELAKSKLDFAKIFHASNAHGAALLSGCVLNVLLDGAR